MKQKNHKMRSWLEPAAKKWKNIACFIITPAFIFLVCYYILQIWWFSKCSTNQTVLCSATLQYIGPLLMAIFGAWFSKEWEEHNNKTIFRNQGEPAIKNIEGIQSDINRRIQDNYPLKKETKDFLKDINTRLENTKEVWNTIKPPQDTSDLKEIEGWKKKVQPEIKASEDKIAREENQR